MKKRLSLCLAALLALLLCACAPQADASAESDTAALDATETCYDETADGYTYDELMALSDIDLLDLFLENGLVLDEGFSHLTKDQLAEIFKEQFDLFIEGATSLNYTGYSDLAHSTQAVYETITAEK